MPRRDPRSRRAGGPGAVALAAVVAGLWGSVATPLGHAQPAPNPEISRAKDLYKSAETAMKDGRYDDATRDYGAAYELSKDPVLLFKIAQANQRAGKCGVAVGYYARYLREGKPSEQFVAVTKQRIAACGGDVDDHGGNAAPSEPRPGPASGGDPGSSPAPSSAASGSPAPGSTASGSPAPSSAASAAGRGILAGSADVAAGSESGSPKLVLTPSNSHKAAWILSGGAIAMITLGGVLAYASSSSENDIRDLYVGFAGQPATFDAQTQKKYNDMVDQGRRYQHLSWAAFGIAGAAAAAAAVLFVAGRSAEPTTQARVTPLVTTHSAGVAVTF